MIFRCLVNNIEKGQITLHPGGIPHGPHPGTFNVVGNKKDLMIDK